MPTIIRFGRYVIFFWVNENEPTEPVHVHVAIGHAVPNATKLWITSSGEVIVCNNNSRIPEYALRKIIRVIEENVDDIIEEWRERFGEVRYIR